MVCHKAFELGYLFVVTILVTIPACEDTAVPKNDDAKPNARGLPAKKEDSKPNALVIAAIQQCADQRKTSLAITHQTTALPPQIGQLAKLTFLRINKN